MNLWKENTVKKTESDIIIRSFLKSSDDKSVIKTFSSMVTNYLYTTSEKGRENTKKAIDALINETEKVRPELIEQCKEALKTIFKGI